MSKSIVDRFNEKKEVTKVVKAQTKTSNVFDVLGPKYGSWFKEYILNHWNNMGADEKALKVLASFSESEMREIAEMWLEDHEGDPELKGFEKGIKKYLGQN